MKKTSVYSFLILLLYVSIIFSIVSIGLVSFSPLYLIGISFVVIGIIQDIKGKCMPRIIINSLAVLSVIFIFLVSFNITALFVFAKNIIVTFLGIKSLEKKAPRDIYQIMILQTMGMGMIGVSNTDLRFLLMLLIWVFLSIFIFLVVNVFKSLKNDTINTNHIKIMSVFVSVLSVSTAILGFFIFLIMPRIQSPILNIGVGGISNTVGFSNNLSPSNATNVLENTATVFRVFNIKGNVDLKNAYFIGQTLDYFNGVSWTHKHSAHGAKSLSGKEVSYTVMIEPSYDNVLFAIAYPQFASVYKNIVSASITRDYTIKTDKPIIHRTVYRVRSYMTNFYKQQLLNEDNFLELPKNIDPSIVKLASFLKAKYKDPIKAVSEFFNNEHFKYSLNNPISNHFLYDFLFKYRYGNCEAYASSTALLLRLMGVPSRVVVGFHGAFYNKDGNYYFITNSLAHSWVEAYYNGVWQTVDTTPSSYVQDMPKLSKLRLYLDYINYLWDINVVYYSDARQKYLMDQTLKSLKTFIKQDLEYVVYISIGLYVLYWAFKKIVLMFSIRAMYRYLCSKLKDYSKDGYCRPESLPEYIVNGGFKEFFYFYIKACYSKDGISKKEKALAKEYYKKTLENLKTFKHYEYQGSAL